KLNAYRFFHRTGADQRLAEFAAFANATDAMTGSEDNQKAFRAAIKAQWPKIEGTWCDLAGTFALAMAADPEPSRSCELRLWATLETFRRDTQGDVPSAEQSLAAEGLSRLAHRRPLDLNKIEQLTIQIQSDGAALSVDIPTNALLSNIATAQVLPKRLIDYLFGKLDHPDSEFDFDPLMSARILACNAHFLDDHRKAEIKQWLEMHAAENHTMSVIHEALGCAALDWPLDAGELALLVGKLSPFSRF